MLAPIMFAVLMTVFAAGLRHPYKGRLDDESERLLALPYRKMLREPAIERVDMHAVAQARIFRYAYRRLPLVWVAAILLSLMIFISER